MITIMTITCFNYDQTHIDIKETVQKYILFFLKPEMTFVFSKAQAAAVMPGQTLSGPQVGRVVQHEGTAGRIPIQWGYHTAGVIKIWLLDAISYHGFSPSYFLRVMILLLILLGGLEDVLCSTKKMGISFPTDFHMFQRGSNHQPDYYSPSLTIIITIDINH
jgi:hypothetical protein